MATAYPRVLPYDPVLDALDRAPMGDPLTAELEAEIARAEDDLRSGRVEAVPHAEVQRVLAEMRRQQGG
jgi:hypothetical protein